MVRIRKGSTILLLVVIVVTVLVVVLGVLQFQWLNQLSQADELKLRRSLSESAKHILEASRDEVQVLMALLYINPEDYQSKNWEQFNETYQLWKTNTQFPKLVSAIYLFSEGQTNIRALKYDEEQAVFSHAEMPDLIGIDGESTSFWQFSFRQHGDKPLDPLGNDFIFLPIYRSREKDRETRDAIPEGPEDSTDVLAVIAIRIDRQTIYSEIIPHYTEYYLQDYPYRIVDLRTGETIVDSESVPAAMKPELEVPLWGALLIDERVLAADDQREPPRSPTASVFEQYGEEDPSFRFWLRRLLSARRPGDGPLLEAGIRSESEYTLEIYYPGRPLDDLVQARLWSNMGVSLGILILLVASMVVLLRFYRNTEKLREMEQEFVASMSHELRTPIAVLQSTSENLKKGVVTDTSRLSRYGTIIHREVKRLSRTLEGILLYSGLEKRSWNGLQSAGVDLGQLVGDVVESLREPAEEARASITVHQSIPDHRIIADPTGLRLIMENLIINAIRHGLPEADRADTPREIRLYVKSQRLGRELSIRVEDNGSGIPAKETKTIFDPFVRGEASVSAQRPGSGLGLHLVKQVVKILGGTISLESPYQDLTGKEQSGCRFVVLLPIQQEEMIERKGAGH